MDGIWLVVMGVSGCGKSTLGEALSKALVLPMIEGDDHHPPENHEKMSKGIALTDVDRAGWLDALGQALAAEPRGAVLASSALKRAYRDQLRAAVPGLKFVFMEIDREESERRVASRAGAHIFPASLVASQFETLESPVGEDGVITVDATTPVQELVAQVRRALSGARG
jgi:gluconokinase